DLRHRKVAALCGEADRLVHRTHIPEHRARIDAALLGIEGSLGKPAMRKFEAFDPRGGDRLRAEELPCDRLEQLGPRRVVIQPADLAFGLGELLRKFGREAPREVLDRPTVERVVHEAFASETAARQAWLAACPRPAYAGPGTDVVGLRPPLRHPWLHLPLSKVSRVTLDNVAAGPRIHDPAARGPLPIAGVMH